MKSPEQVLREWAEDRISFKRRDRKRMIYLSRINVERLCQAITNNDPMLMLGTRVNPTIVNKSKGIVVGGRYAKSVVYWPDAQKVAMLVCGKRIQLHPSVLIKFDDIGELLMYLMKLPEPGSV